MGRSLKDATGNTTTVPTPATPGTTYRRPHYQKQLLFIPSTGTVGDSYDSAMAESVNGAYKTELVWRSKPFRTLGELELATFHKTPQQVENEYYEHQTAQAASL